MNSNGADGGSNSSSSGSSCSSNRSSSSSAETSALFTPVPSAAAPIASAMSARPHQFNCIPLDWLAHCASWLGSIHDFIALHSVNHHWRQLNSYTYRYAYQQTGFVWQVYATDCVSTCTPEVVIDRFSRQFPYLGALRISTFSPKDVTVTRRAIYLALSRFVCLKYLVIQDFTGCLECNKLAKSMAHITTLVLFGYEVCSNHDVVCMPDSMHSVLCQSHQLRGVGGETFIRSLTQTQWIQLLRATQIQFIASIPTRLENTHFFSLFDSIRESGRTSTEASVNSAITRRRSMKRLTPLDPCGPISDPNALNIYHAIGFCEIRSLALSNVPLEDFPKLSSFTLLIELEISLPPALIPSQLTWLAQLVNLRSLSLPHVSGEQLNDISFRHCISELPELRSLELGYCELTDDTFVNLICACKRLLQLSCTSVRGITKVGVIRMVESHPSIQLLYFQSCMQLKIVELQQASPRCKQLIENGRQTDWLDLVASDGEIPKKLRDHRSDQKDWQQHMCSWFNQWQRFERINQLV